jgi:7-cyano-7-deazaguanine synthase
VSLTESPSLVLLSGGMDSVTALYHAHAAGPVRAALSFDYGSKHNARELPLARWHAEKLGIEHHVVRLDFVAQHFTSDLLTTGGEIPKGHYE